jgi:hypothetical protein
LEFDLSDVLAGRTVMVRVDGNSFKLFGIDELSPKLPVNLSRHISGKRESIFKIGTTIVPDRRPKIFGSRGK